MRRICLSLPGTIEQPYGGLPGFRVQKRLLARIRVEPDALVVMRPFIEEKEARIAAEPGKYFQTPHYEGHPAILVHLDAVDEAELCGLLTESWLLVAPKRLERAFRAGWRLDQPE